MGRTTGEDQSGDDAFTRTGSFGYQVNHLARLLARSLRARIEPLGVVPGQFAQLLALYEEDGLIQSELTERVRIDQSTLAHTIKRMERDGLVTRVQDEVDRRRFRVFLTDHARELRPRLLAAAAEVNELVLDGLETSERQALLQALAQATGRLEADPAVAGKEGKQE